MGENTSFNRKCTLGPSRTLERVMTDNKEKTLIPKILPLLAMKSLLVILSGWVMQRKGKNRHVIIKTPKSRKAFIHSSHLVFLKICKKQKSISLYNFFSFFTNLQFLFSFLLFFLFVTPTVSSFCSNIDSKSSNNTYIIIIEILFLLLFFNFQYE